SAGQVLQWNGSAWAPATPAAGTDNQQLSLSGAQLTISNGNTVTLPTGTTYTAGSGIGIAGNQISNTGDGNAADDLTLATNFAGDVTGTSANLQIAPGAVGTSEIADGSIGAADLQPGAVQPSGIAQNGASAGQVLQWNGSAWAPATPAAGADNQQLSLSGNQLTISNGNTVSLPAETDGSVTNELQTLSLNGSQLNLSNGGGSVTLPIGITYTAGAGISIAGDVITNTGDTNAANDILNTTVADGDITGVFSSLTIKPARVGTTQLSNNSVTAEKLTSLGATAAGQVLKWNGSAWAAGTDLQGSGGGSLTLPFSGTCSTTGPEGIGFRMANTADQSGMYILNTYPNSFNALAAIVGENIGNTQLPLGAEFAAPAYGVQGIANIPGQDGTGVQGIGSSVGVSGISTSGVGGVFTGSRSLIAGAGVGLNTFVPERTVHIKQSGFGGIGDSGLKIENQAGDFDVEMAVFNSRLEFYFNNAGAIAAIQPNGQYVNISDRRLKKDIQRFEASVLGRVNSLPMYTYRYKQEKDNAALSFGVLAQELQERFPELVSEGKNRTDGQSYLGVAYDKLGLIAIKAIQEQQQVIEQQQTELAQVKKDLSDLQQQMAQMAKTVAELQARQK
ncbi:MAG TPA: tail fiber domain-containing protein, partial [Saprospiraceae bacterium]|nr:tail fiber domain-containing protein [Saprospiraceae bacterium]HPI07099.1 tail fiber domain-containing protein [Saprospiraceae bacterium]